MFTTKRAYAAMIAAAAFGGIVCGNVFAADVDKLAVTTNNTDMKGVYVGQGEDKAGLERAAKMGITKYEPEGQEGGMGAPQKTLIDNDVVKVNLVAFKKGFTRSGSIKRRYDTLLVYVDTGRYSIMAGAGGPANASPVMQHLLPGSAVFHRKESIISESRIDEDYRVLFVMMKR